MLLVDPLLVFLSILLNEQENMLLEGSTFVTGLNTSKLVLVTINPCWVQGW